MPYRHIPMFSLLFLGGVLMPAAGAMAGTTTVLATPSSVLRLPPTPVAAAKTGVASPAAGAVPWTAATNPGSATQQGYVAHDSAYARALLRDAAALQSPYQLGEVVVPPRATSHPVSGDARRAGWLRAWTRDLMRRGVPAAQIAFEARRLDARQFHAWAWRRTLPGALARPGVPTALTAKPQVAGDGVYTSGLMPAGG